jgi:hypothetical protein
VLAGLIRENDAQVQQQIEFWEAGAPAYRWIDLINARLLAGTPTTAYPHRVYTYVALAMYDATIATWESKYAYNRSRPSERDHRLPTALPVPNSPSYPSEHAAAAQAAASVLAYFLPAEAQSFQTMAEQAGWSRVRAGLQYPSDYYAGLALGQGRRAGHREREGGQLGCRWTGSVPVGRANGRYQSRQRHGGKLDSATDFSKRIPPAPPPACDSPQVLAETVTVRNFPRTFVTNYKAFYWQSRRSADVAFRYADNGSSKIASIESAACRPRLCLDRAVMPTPSSAARMASSPTGICVRIRTTRHRSPVSRPELPELPSNHSTFSPHGPRSSLPVSNSCRFHSRGRRRPATRGSGPAFTTPWTTSRVRSLGNPLLKSSSRGRKAMARSDLVPLDRAIERDLARHGWITR